MGFPSIFAPYDSSDESTLTYDFGTADYVSLFIVFICLLFVLYIGIVSTKQLHQQNNMGSLFKYVFHVSWIIATLALSSFATITILRLLNKSRLNGKIGSNAIINEFGFIFADILALMILMMLLLRLYYSFRNSIFRISKLTLYILCALYGSMILYILYVFVVIMTTYSKDHILETLVLYYNIILVPVYIITTVTVIVLFAKKLMLLSDSMSNMSINITLNKDQIEIIENTTRYVSLLSLGIFTSFCGFVLLFILQFAIIKWCNDEVLMWYLDNGIPIAYIVTSIDCVINVICLYLQYGFTKAYYFKYCGYLHGFWRAVLTKKATNDLEKRYKQAMDESEDLITERDY